MKIGDYAIRLDKALKSKQSIVVFCNCEVNYSGRAESFLAKGDRVVMIKEDSALLVHQPKGNNPVNYMKPDSNHSVQLNKGILKICSQNLALKEYMDIIIHEVYTVNSRKLEDGESIVLCGTEKDMAEMIFNNPEVIEQGFKPLSMEEHTKFGFIDVFGYDQNRTLIVIECKRFTVDFKAVSQLERYVKKVKESKGLEKVRGILAAPKISPNAKTMLEQLGFEFKSLEPPKHLERFNKNQKRLDGF